MKTKIFLFLSLFMALNLIAQDTYTYMAKASSNTSDAAEAFNLKNLKYYAKIAKTANDVTVSDLKSSDCINAQDLSVSVAIHLESALIETDFATAKAHMITSKDLFVRLFYEYDLCSTRTTANDNTNDELSQLEQQQKLLKEQQAELERKNKEIQQKLAEQKLKEAEELKQQFITKNKNAIAKNIVNYNTSLNVCNCEGKTIKEVVYNEDLSALDIGELKTLFLEKTIGISQSYISLLNDCKPK